MSEFHSAFHQKAKELIPEFLYEQIKSAAIPMSGAQARWKMSGPSIFEKIAIPQLRPERLKNLKDKELKTILSRLNRIFVTAKRTKEDTSAFLKASNWVVQEMRERKLSIDTKLAVIQEYIGKTDDEVEKTLQGEIMRDAPMSDRGYTVEETLQMVSENGKFTLEQANYIDRAPDGHTTCSGCRFFMRSMGEAGTCQVVDGDPIYWFAKCDLNICAKYLSEFRFRLAQELIHSELMDQALGLHKASEMGNDDDENTDPKKPVMELVKAKIRKRIRPTASGKWEVTDDSGQKVLGTHDKRSDAIRQLAAIESSKLKRQGEETVKQKVKAKLERETNKLDKKCGGKVDKGQPTLGQVHQPGSGKDEDEEDDEIKKEDVWFNVPIAKIDKKKQKIYGIVLEPEETDTQDDTVSAEEIEKAAESFMLRSRRIGLRHRKVAEGVELTDSYVTQGRTKLGPKSLKVGTWIIGVKVKDPALWAGVERGEYNGFSVGGHGTRRKNA